MKLLRVFICFSILAIAVQACSSDDETKSTGKSRQQRFVAINAAHSNIQFSNNLTYSEDFNPYTYRNFYNGAGVGLGDMNGDGQTDIFFCGNMVSNRLYLNKGDFVFEDITQAAGVTSDSVWSTGVSIADINGDGLLDLFVCKSGKPQGSRRHNELLINQGNNAQGIPTFVDKSFEYGVADIGLSIHAAFFDYDKDGDLDFYLLSNSIRSVGGFDLKPDHRLIRDPLGGNKLYRNDGQRFVDVSEHAGIFGSIIGYGLGVMIADVDRDGWQDIYVSNDFFEKDYLYINNKNGTFRESLEEMIGEISLGSMGADIADLNNDGYPEIFVTEMLPENNGRLKTKTIFEDWDKFSAAYQSGYYKQFPRNVLQLNRGPAPGNSSGKVMFSEISRFSGVHATDWSWGALLADFDNDGLKDIFVANGIFKDLTDLDYVNYYADPVTTKRLYEERGAFLKTLVDKIPSTPIPNYMFKNDGDMKFSNVTTEWSLDTPSFSNGSAYGDLDNDGDLDLVINNVNMSPFIFQNKNEDFSRNHFLTVNLSSSDDHVNSLGAQVSIKAAGKTFYQELSPMRGYQSSVEQRLHFGLGENGKVDSLIVAWPDNTKTILTDLLADRSLVIDHKSAHAVMSSNVSIRSTNPPSLLTEVKSNFTEKHVKSDFVDFNRDPLLFQMVSAEGPHLAVGDVNGDKLDDVFLCAGTDHASALYIQSRKGTFNKSELPAFKETVLSDDVAAEFLDADGDGDLDLYVATGGNEFLANSPELEDRLYINNGKGEFYSDPKRLPMHVAENNSCVKAADFDGDGDQDLFVGVRTRPFKYGMPVSSFLLRNNGKGVFEDYTAQAAPELNNIGMVTDAEWFDMDSDGRKELVVVGDWMSLKVFKNDGVSLKDVSADAGLGGTEGLWNCIEIADLNSDNKPDLVVGNEGDNTRFKASAATPATMYVADFDGNGKVEQLMSVFNGDNSYPVLMRADLVDQVPSLKKKYVKYRDYANETAAQIFGADALNKSVQLRLYTTSSACFVNVDGKFVRHDLPNEVQWSQAHAICIDDFNNDQIPDLLVGGNFYWAKPELGINDASFGSLLMGQGDGTFKPVAMNKSGLCIRGEVRDIKRLNIGSFRYFLVARNNNSPVLLKRN